MKDCVLALEKWYLKNRRDLPWRRAQNPYFTWVSEIMLQQTQVATVIPYFHKFTERFPDIKSLAKAPQAEVFKYWAGLGYYSRSRNLQRGAKMILEKFGGALPRQIEDLMTIPGIGRYTAGAIASITYGVPAPIVDGNVKRVFARFYGLKKPIDSREANDFFWEKAQEWVESASKAGDLNQALMELGATLCLKANPCCRTCPLQNNCVALAKNITQKIPRRGKKASVKHLHWLGMLYTHQDQVFLVNDPKTRWWKGLWDFPRVELTGPQEIGEALKTITGTTNAAITPLPRLQHTVTHHRITVYPYELKIKMRKNIKWSGEWFPMGNLPATSSLVKKIVQRNMAAAAN